MGDSGCVCMFHIGRSGSSVLADMLGRHPRVFWDGEVFEPASKKWSAGIEPGEFLRSRRAKVPDRIYGIEYKPFHRRFTGQTLPETIAMLEGLGFRKHNHPEAPELPAEDRVQPDRTQYEQMASE